MKLRLCVQRDCAFPLGDNASDIAEGNVVGPELWPHLIEPLEYNSKRSFAVKALQTALIDLHGCNCVRADGYFGKITLEAVQDFQSDYAANRIDVDGVAGELTWLHLLGCLPESDHY
jgi:peptidoglycan hydrolase-like protein with peptidoglycan-binding domain